MGVRGLLSFIKPLANKVSFPDAVGLRIAIDASYYLHKWAAEPDKFIQWINQFDPTTKLLFVFDGRPAPGKEIEIAERLEIKNIAEKTVINIVSMLATTEMSLTQRIFLEKELVKEQKRAERPSKKKRHLLKSSLYDKGIPMLKSMGEADELLVALVKEGDIDIIITGDTDVIRLGGERVWIPTLYDDTQFNEYKLSTILQSLRLTNIQFQDLCILCGIDCLRGSNSFEIKKSYNYISIYGSLENLRTRQIWYCSDDIWKNIVYLKNLTVENNVMMWVREDELERLVAWRENVPMPYYLRVVALPVTPACPEVVQETQDELQAT